MADDDREVSQNPHCLIPGLPTAYRRVFQAPGPTEAAPCPQSWWWALYKQALWVKKNNKAISNDNKTKDDNLCSAFEFVLVLV